MRWRMLALLFFARIGLGFQFQTLASVGDGLVVAFGLDYAGIGLLIGLFMAPGLLWLCPPGILGVWFQIARWWCLDWPLLQWVDFCHRWP